MKVRATKKKALNRVRGLAQGFTKATTGGVL